MEFEKEIAKIDNGAKFLRADLHIHSYGPNGSYDVIDQTMTPKNIVDTCILEELDIISITDHNEISNVEEAINYGKGESILIIPGVELSTPNGHLLVYFPSFYDLKCFYGKLNITPDKKICKETITQCLDIALIFNGFGVAAHIDLDNGFEKYMNGYTPFKESILLHKNLLGLEISNPLQIDLFTLKDKSSDRKGLFNKRKKLFNDDLEYSFTKLLSSDSHTLKMLGKNAAGNNKLTRLKIDQPDFDSFKIALLDPSARVRIEELIPKSYPYFTGIKFDGGFLDSQIVKFSNNLTCIIGGRGTGKSTIFESIRIASGNLSNASMIDSEVWPERISLLYIDETGRKICFIRDKLTETINSTDGPSSQNFIPIEVIGQGETISTLKNIDKDQSLLMDFFDGLIDFDNLKTNENIIRRQLLDNQTSIEHLLVEVSKKDIVEKSKKYAEKQLNELKEQKAKEIVELEEGLSKEQSLREELIKHLKTLIKDVNNSLADKSLFELVLSINDSDIKIGKDEFKTVKESLKAFSLIIDNHSELLNEETEKLRATFNAHFGSWIKKERVIHTKIEEIRKKLESQGIKLDMAFIRKVTKDLSDFTTQLRDLNQKNKHLQVLQKERIRLLDERRKTKDEIFKLRYSFIYRADEILDSNISEFKIKIKLYNDSLSLPLQNIIKDAMNWKTQRVPKASLLVTQLPYFELLKCLKEKDIKPILKIKNPDTSNAFSKEEAIQLVQTLSQNNILFQIERCEIMDRPEIKVSKQYTDDSGIVKTIQKDFSKLSIGQQQSIILSILLLSNRNCPLLIDQPEDNLDSEFIYKTLVGNLRSIKETRQVIIVTHNANLAILGDSELLIPLKSSRENTTIIDRGSIDNKYTKSIACNILEGGKKAFERRKIVYGI
jgi:ABC-type cobalamin/Fe3+-siderophores transport system ATPase subunit